MSFEDELDKKMRNIQHIQNFMRQPICPDSKVIDMDKQIMANSAFELQRIQEQNEPIYEEMAEQREKLHYAIQQTAEESVAHTRLLENQLKEAKTQNDLLQNNYNTLSALYEKVKEESASNKEEAIESRKATRKANHLSICALVISSILSVCGIVASVLMALYL